MLEAMNSLVQAAKARARGYRSPENFITMAYLVCGKLNFRLPT
jgi:transposase